MAFVNWSSDLINWSPDHRTPSCDSAQDPLYNQQSYTATITNNQHTNYDVYSRIMDAPPSGCCHSIIIATTVA